jgi:hypothetical protein
MPLAGSTEHLLETLSLPFIHDGVLEKSQATLIAGRKK